MFDPLSSTSSIFAEDSIPPWPTTPHQPNSPIPNLRRASTPIPPTPEKGLSGGIYGKEPQIYGQPEPGLISPRDTVSSNGTKYEKSEPYLRVRVTGIDRNRRDILFKLDAQTNLSNFTGTTYRNVSRSYLEFQQFYDSIIQSNPQTIIPALPLAQTSAPTDEEDDRLVKLTLQRWMTRVCEDPIILHDEDLRSFIESDFGYQPTPRQRRKTGSGFALIRRGVPDEDEELQRARFELTKLEGQFFDTAKAIDKIAVARKTLALANVEMGNKLINVATTEAHAPLGNALRKIGRSWHSLADLNQAQAISECVIVGDSFGYQGMNARSAKDTLLQRTSVLEEYQAAVKTTISKRRHIERLKASSNIRPDRVDEALEDMEDADKYEQVLAKRAEGISQNLHRALQTYNQHANDDLTAALIEHTRSSIVYEKQLLRELEALRPDINNCAIKVTSNIANGVPRPSVVPPLEDFTDPPLTRSETIPSTAPPSTYRPPAVQQPQQPQTHHVQDRGVPVTAIQPSFSRNESSSFGRKDPLLYSIPSSNKHESLSSAPSPAYTQRGLMIPQSPGAGPSTPPNHQITFAVPSDDDAPPLGGRFVEGTKSMFIKRHPSPLSSPALASSSSSQFSPGPLQRAQIASSNRANPLSRASTLPAIDGAPIGINGHGSDKNESLDPLGQGKPNFMSSSLRVPTRSRLDAKEAASKLASMF